MLEVRVQRTFRLTRSQDFKRVRQSGKSYAHPLIVLVAQANDEMKIRVGVAAGRTVGTAVKRNRAKRLLREAMRPLIPSLAIRLGLDPDCPPRACLLNLNGYPPSPDQCFTTCSIDFQF